VSVLIARLLLAVAVTALVILVIITITGGFILNVGPVHLSAHNWRGPLLIAIAALLVGAFVGRAMLTRTATESWQFLDLHSLAFAIVLAAASAGIGIAYGTYAASSSDASGYVSEAALIASAQLSTDEPLARAVAWRNATWAFAPLGYRPGTVPGELVPTYAAGLPLVMTPFRLLVGELAAYLVVPLLGAIAVLATYLVGARLHSPLAGLAAAALLATSPIVLFQIVQPMGDVPVTAWWTIAVLFALSPLPKAPLAAGGAAGLGVLTRPNLLPLALVVALVTMKFPRIPRFPATAGSPTRLPGFFAGITPAVGAQLLTQWRLYGSPLATGYGAARDLYSLGAIAPNVRGYAGRLIEGETPALIVAAAALVLVTLTRRQPADAPDLKPALILAALASAFVVASYLPYAVFAEWSYLRFLLPAFPFLFIVVGGLFVAAMLRLPPPIRATVFLCTLAAVGSFNVLRARHEQAFNMQRYESRYRFAGRYLASALPSAAVIVTVQESGSARYYTGRPILRWDQLDLDLDTAVAALRAMGRYPVFLVEDWERPDLIKKHPGSIYAQLGWRPRVEFGDETRVFLYDPLDRSTPPRWHADRVH
jgi:Dolichyl-phosphate-mannose-protein mannosyltransferase